MPRYKIDPKVGQKAHAAAARALKAAHADEYADLLDAAYAEQGEMSPRARARAKAEETAKGKAVRAAKAAAREAARLEEAEALLRSAGYVVAAKAPGL
jgi:hypothetical protein